MRVIKASSIQAMRIEDLLQVPVARLQRRFRGREARLRVEAPVIVRLDGVGFSRLAGRFEAPRDPRVHEALMHAASVMVERYGILGAHVFSDEINLYMLRDPLPYGGRVEKLCSIMASIAGSEASLSLAIPLYFDGRVVSLLGACEALEYTVFRMRVGLGNYARLLAKTSGLSLPEKIKLPGILALLRSHGMNVGIDWRSTGSFLLRTAEGLTRTTLPDVFLESLREACSR